MGKSQKIKMAPKYKGGKNNNKGINRIANKYAKTANKIVEPTNKMIDIVDHIKKQP